jgi:phosphoenolpyruvate-protein kinase (PTS system EI component)
MGWRSIRLSFEHPEFFMTQIRAVLRAGHAAEALGGRVSLLFPMVTTVEELRRLRSLVRRAASQLKSRRKKFAAVPIGMMLEVPAAAVSIESMLEVADFVSIGSNDLVQYLMAADRDNPKVSHLCQPLSPPVLRVLANVIACCNAADKPVTLCGEMAGEPSSFVVLLGMGLKSFSMSASFLPTIKELAAHLTRRKAERILAQALRLKTTAQVKRFLHQQVCEIAPDLSILESG